MSTQKSPTGRILVGTDGSPASVAAVRWAGREAQLRGMQVHVVYVQDRRRPAPAYYAPRPRASEGAAASGGESTLEAVVREALGTQPAGVQMELADGAPARRGGRWVTLDVAARFERRWQCGALADCGRQP